MGYSYTPTYYSSLHDSITSLCKSILPFRRRRLPNPQQKRQSDNLKWQQDAFHRILHLIALHREGIIPNSDVSSFRTHLLDTLISSPSSPDPPPLLRDKLLFLQELLYAKCISQTEYHSSKRPLLQRLAVHGVDVDMRDLVIAGANGIEEEEWSDIDLRDHKESPPPPKKSKHRSPLKPLRNAIALFGNKQTSETNTIDPPRNSCTVLMQENAKESTEMGSKKKSLHALFGKEQWKGGAGKKTLWGFDGLKKWKRDGGVGDEATAQNLPPVGDRSEETVTCELVATPVGEGPNTRRIKSKLHGDGNPSDFFIDKVLGDNIKKELTKIQNELGSTHKSLAFSEEQMEAISTKLPVEKGDLKEFFPKTWCDRYGDVVLDVVKKEFKGHISDMEERRNATMEKRSSISQKWVAFDDSNQEEENRHPNVYSSSTTTAAADAAQFGSSNNPFSDAPPLRNPFANKNSNPFLDDERFINPFSSSAAPQMPC